MSSTLKRKIERLEQLLGGGPKWVLSIKYWDNVGIIPHYFLFQGVRGNPKQSKFIRNLTDARAQTGQIPSPFRQNTPRNGEKNDA